MIWTSPSFSCGVEGIRRAALLGLVPFGGVFNMWAWHDGRGAFFFLAIHCPLTWFMSAARARREWI